MPNQPFPLCPCAGCMGTWLEWAEQVHDMGVLARQDVLTEQQWRDEFRSWVDSGPDRGAS